MTPLLVEAVPGAATQALVPVQNPTPPPGQGEEFGKASPIALVVIILLALVTITLIRSMTKRIRRLPANFDPPAKKERKKARNGEKAGGDAGDAGDGHT